MRHDDLLDIIGVTKVGQCLGQYRLFGTVDVERLANFELCGDGAVVARRTINANT